MLLPYLLYMRCNSIDKKYNRSQNQRKEKYMYIHEIGSLIQYVVTILSKSIPHLCNYSQTLLSSV